PPAPSWRPVRHPPSRPLRAPRIAAQSANHLARTFTLSVDIQGGARLKPPGPAPRRLGTGPHAFYTRADVQSPARASHRRNPDDPTAACRSRLRFPHRGVLAGPP